MEWFRFQLGQRGLLDPVVNNRDVANPSLLQRPLRRFRTDPERTFAIEPMHKPFLPPSYHADRPRIKSFPNRTQNFVQVRDAIRLAPPGCEPRNPVMLINDQVKRLLFSIPSNCFND